MGMLTKEYNENGFKGTIHTLTCDITGKKLVNILVKKSNDELDEPIFMYVKALSPFSKGASSGVHQIGGLLTFGPVVKEESKFPTKVHDVIIELVGNNEIATIYIDEG